MFVHNRDINTMGNLGCGKVRQENQLGFPVRAFLDGWPFMANYFRWQNVDQNWKKSFLIESNSFLAGNAAGPGPPAYTAPQIPLNVPQLFLFLMSRPRIEIKAGE